MHYIIINDSVMLAMSVAIIIGVYFLIAWWQECRHCFCGRRFGKMSPHHETIIFCKPRRDLPHNFADFCPGRNL